MQKEGIFTRANHREVHTPVGRSYATRDYDQLSGCRRVRRGCDTCWLPVVRANFWFEMGRAIWGSRIWDLPEVARWRSRLGFTPSARC